MLGQGPLVHDVDRRNQRSPGGQDDEGRTTIGVDGSSGDQGRGLLADGELVAAVLAGDRDSFRPLVEREGPALVRACYRVLGDLAEAEDVAQEAFVIAYRSLPTWRADGPFGAWLSRIGVRLAIRRARAHRAVVRIDVATTGGRPGPDGRGGPASLDLRAPADRTDPAMVVARGERAAELRRAVARLGEPYGEVVALRFFGERSLAEIADLTGRPLGTVKTHLRRGLLRLRDEMHAGDRR